MTRRFEAISERWRAGFAAAIRAMRTWCRRSLLGLGCLLAAGCAEQAASVNPVETLAQLRAGRPLLTCHEPCLPQWREAQPQAAQLDNGARWQDLAVLLTRVGYQDDLSLYYLGRAAEGIGYRRAAVNYYRQSMLLSRTSTSCRNLSRLCGGIAFPRAASLRVAVIEREINRHRPRRIEQASPESAGPAAAASEDEGPAPVPPPGPLTPPVSDYIEPPPIAR